VLVDVVGLYMGGGAYIRGGLIFGGLRYNHKAVQGYIG
jgi:hypothetical protein